MAAADVRTDTLVLSQNDSSNERGPGIRRFTRGGHERNGVAATCPPHRSRFLSVCVGYIPALAAPQSLDASCQEPTAIPIMIKPCTRPLSGAAIAILESVLLWSSSPPAEAGLLVAVFSGAEAATKGKVQTGRREWTLREFTSIRLVPREPGSVPNEHPLEVEREVLREQLVQVRIDASAQTLFAADELTELLEPLSEALASAGPDDDVLLLSSARRGGLFVHQTAVTARLFVQGGRLQLIVNDTRYAFMDDLLGGRIQPRFTYGSRTRGSGAAIHGRTAEQKRSDWLALPTTGAAPAPAAPASPLAPGQKAAAQPAPAAAPATSAPAVPAAPGAQAPAAPRPRDPGLADEIEQRLLTLKRLRDRGLISEEEYQQKRREILQLL
jgi:hypothetical protein